MEDFGTKSKLRKSPSGGPFVTDNGNYIIDLETEEINNPADLEEEINQIPGVIENGIFTNLLDQLFVGHDSGCKVLNSKEDFLNFIK